MRLVFVLVYIIGISICDEHLRPAAIIPWSQYKQRLAKMQSSVGYQSESEPLTSSDTSNSYFGSYEKSDAALKQLPRFDENELSGGRPKTRTQYGNVIRPQIRGRLPTEPSDFVKMSNVNQREYLVQRVIERESLPERETHTQKHIKNIPSSRIPMKVDEPQTLNRIPSLAFTNGVPLNAAEWESGNPHYPSDRKPMAHAANTFSGSQTFPLANNFIGAGDAISPVYQKADTAAGNMVSTIFAESQARAGAIPSVAQSTQLENQLQKMLGDGTSLDQISKIAKTLLGVGGGRSEGSGSSGGGGLLDVMTSALNGASRTPTSSAAHDDLTQYTPSSAGRPQTSLMEKLLNQAAVALNDSWKKNELKEKAEKDIAAERTETPPASIFETSEKQKNIKLNKDRENSLNLLSGVPDEARKLLEQAIKSGEINSTSAGLKALVKDDLADESKKEKESRLIEWIRSNRPSKNTENVVPDQMPYQGKYLGSFAETPNPKKHEKLSGALFAVDNRRIIVSKFVFHPESLLNENVTFWLGPKIPTANIIEDMMPSENGFYLKPKPIDFSAFVWEELPPIAAKLRPNVDAIKLFEGVPPIVANLTRKRRHTAEGSASVKPIELFVEGGIMKVLPGDGKLEELESSTRMNSLRDGFRLRQPEYDNVNDNHPLPLEWYDDFQPILITLPDNKTLRDLNWVSLRDHKRNSTVATVLLPNGPLVQHPKVYQLRAFSPNNVIYNISSGPIQILDIKTIRILNFSFTNDDDSAWFMIGKDILPNPNGKIVPIYDEKFKIFDCQALRNYHNETITLRLPGKLGMKDVFWFSIFSMKRLISYTHIYLPYSELQPIPDLSSVPTPTCAYKPEL